MFTKNQQGQTLILMLIVTVVSLTVGVAISSRAVSTLKQTSYTAQAGKAQKFADAGVEEALGAADLSAEVGTHTIDLDGGGDDITYTVTALGGGDTVDLILEKDETIEIDLTGYGSGQSIDIFWVQEGTEETDKAALVLTFVYEDGGETKTEKHAYDPNATAHANNFTVPGSLGPYTIEGKSYAHYERVNTPSGTNRALRIRALYNSDIKNTGVVSNGGIGANFPGQGYKITSTGTYGEAEWTAEVTKMNPALPAIFDYAIFSDTGLTK